MTKINYDVEKLLNANCSNVTPHGGSEASINCFNPDCPDSSEHEEHLWVNTSTGMWICYRCGWSGNLVQLVAKLLGKTYDQAAEMIRRGVRRKAGSLDGLKDSLLPGVVAEPPAAKKARSLPEEYLEMPPLTYMGSHGRALQYVAKRCISAEQMRRYQLGYCLRGRYSGRIIIPILEQGRPVYFVARDWTGRARAKVLTPPNVEGRLRASDMVYNLDEALTRDEGVVTEGVFDAIAVKGIALLGKRLSPAQLERILKAAPAWEAVVVMFDNDDPDAAAKANAVARVLSSYFTVKMASLPKGEDPASVSDPQPFVDEADEFTAVNRARLKVREI